jgi:L-lactate dehydrogenase complex protein LldE
MHGSGVSPEVVLFVPCYVDQLSPGVGLAALEVLERAGCRVRWSPAPVCCGQPFLNLGAEREARRLFRRFFEELLGAQTVVCPSASCVSALRHHAPRLGEGCEGEADRLRARVFELGEFLVGELGRVDLGARFPARVALLRSCHGLRELGLGTPSERVAAPEPGPVERLLAAVEGLQLVEPERPDECCGFGGAFSVKFPELSVRIGRDRLRSFARAGAEYVTSTDAGCLLHLAGLRERERAGPRPVHLAEILASRAP